MMADYKRVGERGNGRDTACWEGNGEVRDIWCERLRKSSRLMEEG